LPETLIGIKNAVNINQREQNRSNLLLTEPSLIIEEFGNEVDTIFYSHSKSYFESSTIIDLSKGKLEMIREGKFKLEDIKRKLESV
jgi:tRNA A37 threonylcarbamoyladenosine synthetase subunit TsaC/SUA5/YrdC